MYPNEIGPAIKQMRLEAKLSQAKLAEKAGVSRNCISLLERGVKSNLTLGTLQSIAVALGYRVKITLEDKDNE